MRKLLNTLYVTTPMSYLSLDGENIVVLLENSEKFRMPFVNIESIVCFGYMGASPALMAKCAENNIGLNFMAPNGEFLGKISGKTKGNVLLRKKQYQMADDESFCVKFSQNLVACKLYNSCFSIMRTLRDNETIAHKDDLVSVSCSLKDGLETAFDFFDKDALMGFEGAHAKLYFSVFDNMILQQKKHFSFNGRNKRPPLDNVNCMLSYLYTILSLEISSALETVGLDPYVGFMHELRPGRASLSLDLVEELRAYLVDRLVLSLINLKKVDEKDFLKKEGEGVLFTDDGRRKILTAWQERKKEQIMHPIIGEKIEIGLIPYVQALLLARFLRGDTPEYQNFICR